VLLKGWCHLLPQWDEHWLEIDTSEILSKEGLHFLS
jgi:hypothetical protein